METKASRALHALLNNQGRGAAKRLADDLLVTQSAVSRWRRGEGAPDAFYRKHLETQTGIKAADWTKAVRL